MLSYETAVKLRDAGFPQKCIETYALPDGRFLGTDQIELYEMKTACKIPTLSELIEIFGKDFNFVCQHPKTLLWGAETHSGKVIGSENGLLSAEEAVAKLWLELNKK